jgi:hypothetical protein
MSGLVLLDLVYLIVVLTLVGAALAYDSSNLGDQDSPRLRAFVGALAVAMFVLAVWRGVRDGAWWQLVVGTVLALAYIVFDRIRIRRSDHERSN